MIIIKTYVIFFLKFNFYKNENNFVWRWFLLSIDRFKLHLTCKLGIRKSSKLCKFPSHPLTCRHDSYENYFSRYVKELGENELGCNNSIVSSIIILLITALLFFSFCFVLFFFYIYFFISLLFYQVYIQQKTNIPFNNILRANNKNSQ